MRLLICLFLQFSISQSEAFTLIRNGNTTALGWINSELIFDIDTSCAPYADVVHGAIDRAVDIWAKVPNSSLKVRRGDTVNLPASITNFVGSGATSFAPEGNPIVYCDASFQNNSGLSADSIPGFATGQNINSDSKITGCLLVLNLQSGGDANIATLSSTVVDNVLTHEIGHCIGIGHSSDNQALMYFQTGEGRKTVLAKDDMDAVTFLYPLKEAGAIFPGCAAVATTSSSTSSKNGRPLWFGDLASLLALAVLLRSLWRMRRVASKSPSKGASL